MKKQGSQKFKQKQWVHWGQWVQPTLSACFWDHWSQHNKKFPFAIGRLRGKLLVFDGHFFFEKRDKGVLRAFIQESTGKKRILSILEQWVDDVYFSCKARISEGETLLESLEIMKECCKDVVNPWTFFGFLDSVLEEEIKKICAEKGYDFEAITQSIRPLRKSFTVLQSEEAVKLQKKWNNYKIFSHDLEEIKALNPSLAAEIKKHIQKFAFVGLHHFVGEPYNLERFFEIKESTSPKEKPLKISPELTWYVHLGSIAAWARTHMAETSGMIQLAIKPTLLSTNKELGLNDQDYLWMTADELIQAMKNPKKWKKPNLKDRKEKVGVYSDSGGKEIVVAREKVDYFLKQLIPEQKQSHFPLKGRAASPGKVIGIVRIVIRPEQISKVNEGDILVCPETSPDFIVGMKRAVGVITNQGGITSHAAIISRELGIPCIVGVEHATDILKDGQTIELDAFKGEICLRTK